MNEPDFLQSGALRNILIQCPSIPFRSTAKLTGQRFLWIEVNGFYSNILICCFFGQNLFSGEEQYLQARPKLVVFIRVTWVVWQVKLMYLQCQMVKTVMPILNSVLISDNSINLLNILYRKETSHYWISILILLTSVSPKLYTWLKSASGLTVFKIDGNVGL